MVVRLLGDHGDTTATMDALNVPQNYFNERAAAQALLQAHGQLRRSLDAGLAGSQDDRCVENNEGVHAPGSELRTAAVVAPCALRV